MTAPTLWADVDDLVAHIERRDRMTGIFRVVHELCTALHQDGARFLRHAPDGAQPPFVEIDWPQLARAIAAVEAARAVPPRRFRPSPPWLQRPLRAVFRRLPAPVAVALGGSLQALRTFSRGMVELPGVWRRARAAAVEMALRARPCTLRPGDVVFAPGAPWVDPFHADKVATVRRSGLRFALLVHDIIPLRRPEWCSPAHNVNFGRWFNEILPQVDHLLTISHATANDVCDHAARIGVAVVAPQVVPMGTGFTIPPDSPPSDRLPRAGSYVLFVSTLEGRKNHVLALRIWRRLLEEIDDVPHLVFAGRPGPQTVDLMGQLANSNYLDGAIIHIADASDGELVQLYRGCRFTLFPSLYEGWGLPVTESLSFGRPCLAARATSLPEAGGAFARYFDPDNLHDAVAVVRAAIEDGPGTEAMAAHIRAEFRAPSWADMADAAKAACGTAPKRRVLPMGGLQETVDAADAVMMPGGSRDLWGRVPGYGRSRR